MNKSNNGTEKPATKNQKRWIALHGRLDEPTDALIDYCSYLRKTLSRQGVSLEHHEVSWRGQGISNALGQLWSQSASWKGSWILIQYTALGWSRRGLSFLVLVALGILRLRGVRCAVIFHDPGVYEGERAIDYIRRCMQRWIMRRAYQIANRSIFTIPVKNIDWLPVRPTKASFIPIGANIPEINDEQRDCRCLSFGPKTVVVFSVTGGAALVREVLDIASVIRYASMSHSPLNLLVLGRNSKEAETLMRSALASIPVNLEFLGIVPPEEITRRLSSSHVLLFVRGPVTGARSSALAAVACGLPIVGYRGKDTTFPITVAGLELAVDRSRAALGMALDRVLSDDAHREDLSRMSAQAYVDHYCWEKIASRFIAELTHE